MKSISFILMAFAVMLSTSACNAQIKNAKTETVKIYGNCGMCKTNIEKAGNKKKLAKVDWNENTKMATITYDAKKTNQDEILKRIALSGYDSDKFLAPDDVYNNLHGCCQYERKGKPVATATIPIIEGKEDHSGHNHGTAQPAVTKPTETKPAEPKQEVNQTQAIYNNYFALKDALVKTDAKTAADNAALLLASLNNIDMAKMKMDDHLAFMKVEKALKADATTIGQSKDIAAQRAAFSNLSNNIIAFIKVTKATGAVYIQHCPMANEGNGADWLSKDKAVKNPYYGSMMLSCGKTTETIQ